METLTRPDLPLPVRALAAWFLASTVRFAGFNLRKRPGRHSVLAEVYEKLSVPPDVMRVARMGSTRTREAHPVTLPLVWLELQKSPWREERPEDVPDAPLIGGWPAPAYDMHTRQGKRALALFAETCTPVRDWLLARVSESELIDVIGSLVFRAEGGLVDRRLCHEGSSGLLRSADEAQVGWGTFPLPAVSEALALVRAHLGDLNAARRTVIGDPG